MRRRLSTLLCCAALAGCSFEPHYVRPTPAVPTSWPAGDAYLRASEAELPAVRYQDVFRDPNLQAIIAQALANNQDIRAALANVASAQAQYRIERAQLFPHLEASGGLSTSDRNSNTGTGTGAGTGTGTGTVVTTGTGRTTAYTLGVGVSAFELDLFGRVRSLSHAALQEYLATEAAARAMRLTLVAEVANAYLTLASDRSLLAVAVDTEANSKRSVDLTRARLNGGVAPRTDLDQALTVLNQAQSDRANLTTQVAQDRNALELLVGAPVADAALPVSIESIDSLLVDLPAGLDSRVLLRRPDVVEAEYRLRAANARIGAARAAFFPTISLTATVGLASTALGSLFSHNAFNWSVGPSISAPIFDFGAMRGNLAYARAQDDLFLAQYQRAIQTAFREVSDALARRGTIERQLAAQTSLEAAARDNYQLANARYQGGIDPFLNALDAQRTYYSARRTRVSTQLLRAQNLATLYQVVGGDELSEVGPPPR